MGPSTAAYARRSRTLSCDTAYYQKLSNGTCRLKGADPGKNNDICQAGDNGSNPVHSATGSKLQQEVDYQGSGANRLRFVRRYASAKGFEPSGLGPRWQHNYARNIKVINFNVTATHVLTTASVTRENGDRYYFNLNTATGQWVGDPDVNGTLQRLLDGSGNVAGWHYTSDDVTEHYDAAGKLISIRYRDLWEETLTYSTSSTPPTIAPAPDLLLGVSDTVGNALNFRYDSDGRIVELLDPAGNAYLYAYDSHGNLARITYPDATPAMLTDNPKRTYLYGEMAHTANVAQPHALTGLIDEANQRYATWDYAANQRAIASEHAGGVDKTVLTYNADGTTRVTDPLGTSRTYRFQLKNGVYKSAGVDQPGGAGCAASASAIDYDANGNLASRVDFNGNRTNYSYDLTRNLETRRTEGLTATGAPTPETRTVLTEWHPVFRLPVKMTAPGLETAYEYDDRGHVTLKRLTDLVSHTVREWRTTYTYADTASGAVLQKVEDGPRTDVDDRTTYDYYPPDEACLGGHAGCRGQLKQITTALDQQSRFTRYSADGQPEEIQDPNGLITTLAYDARRRLVSATVGNETTAYAYHPTGQLARVTEPSGAYLSYSYDSAHRLTSIRDDADNLVHYTLDNKGNRIKTEVFDASGQLARRQGRVYDALARLQTLIQTP